MNNKMKEINWNEMKLEKKSATPEEEENIQIQNHNRSTEIGSIETKKRYEDKSVTA